jgi:hypothetical protein
LETRGLARGSEDAVSIPMHPMVRSLVLVLLAQILKEGGASAGPPAVSWRSAYSPALRVYGGIAISGALGAATALAGASAGPRHPPEAFSYLFAVRREIA